MRETLSWGSIAIKVCNIYWTWRCLPSAIQSEGYASAHVWLPLNPCGMQAPCAKCRAGLRLNSSWGKILQITHSPTKISFLPTIASPRKPRLLRFRIVLPNLSKFISWVFFFPTCTLVRVQHCISPQAGAPGSYCLWEPEQGCSSPWMAQSCHIEVQGLHPSPSASQADAPGLGCWVSMGGKDEGAR